MYRDYRVAIRTEVVKKEEKKEVVEDTQPTKAKKKKSKEISLTFDDSVSVDEKFG